MESIFHLPARPLSPRPPAPHISFSPESCWALRMHRFRLPPSSRQVGRTRPASGQAALQRLSRRIRAKEGELRCEATTNPCHPCDPRTVPLSNPNILELTPEIRTAPRTLPRWLITSPATFAQVQDHGGSIRTFRTSPSRRSSTSSRWWRGCRSWRSRRPPSSTLRAAAVPLLHGLIPRASSDAPSPPRVQERQSLAEARAVAPARPGGGS